MILGLAVLGSPGYEIAAWHQTLLTIAIVAFSAFFNIYLAARLPITEAVVLILHIAGVFVIIIPLWVTAPRGNAYDTIFKFTNGGGWGSDGLSYVIGIVPMIGMLIVSITEIRVTVKIWKALHKSNTGRFSDIF
jgi:choline transport protein